MLTPWAPDRETIGASKPLVLFTDRINAFFLCPSPEDATLSVIVPSSASSESTLARLVRAYPGPEGGGDFRIDMTPDELRTPLTDLEGEGTDWAVVNLTDCELWWDVQWKK